MDTVTYPSPVASQQLSEFACCRLDVAADADLASRHGVVWTPTLLFLTADGREGYRYVGFLPPDHLPDAVSKARGHLAALAGRWDQAEPWFRAAADGPFGAGALYWLGVARLRQGRREEFLAAWTRLLDDHPQSPWAKAAAFIRQG